jgi:hypothetical protein
MAVKLGTTEKFKDGGGIEMGGIYIMFWGIGCGSVTGVV